MYFDNISVDDVAYHNNSVQFLRANIQFIQFIQIPLLCMSINIPKPVLVFFKWRDITLCMKLSPLNINEKPLMVLFSRFKFPNGNFYDILRTEPLDSDYNFSIIRFQYNDN
uniref:Uncharacterized protein n=1 Tax=Glossina brevipalpis TaxID=37001 RepID=A0A1A9WYH3_9MUSC